MPVLREVVTRFKFEADEAGAKKIDRRVDSMKRGIGGMAKLFGVGLGVAGVKAMSGLAVSTERAEFVLQNLAGINFKPLRNNMVQIKKDLSGLREGAGQLFTTKEYDQAAAAFVREFGTNRDKLELFDQIFRSAAKQSAVTGDNVMAIADGLTNAVRSGDFSALMELPGIDQAIIKQIQDINELFNAGEIGGQSAINQRQNVLSKWLSDVSKQQNDTLKNIPNLILQADKAGKSLQQSIDDLAKRLGELLVPILEKVNVLLDQFNPQTRSNFFRAVDKPISAGPLGDLGLAKILKNAKPPEPVKQAPANTAILNWGGPGTAPVTIKNTFNIDGTKPAKEIAKEVDKIQRETFQKARKMVVPTEDR